MARQLLRWRRRAALPATLMRPCPVAGRHVLAEHAGQLPLAADEHVVEARATRAPEEPCAHGMRLWRARRGPQDRAATGRRDAGARRPARAIVVADQGARALAEGGGLAPLLGDPGVGRLARRAQVDDAPRGQFDDEAGAQRPEEAVGDREEVARPAVGDVVAQERRPRLPARARRAVAAQLGLARALRHADAQLAQCAAAPRGTPARVLGRQPPDQGDGLRREGRAVRPRVRSPPPARPEPGAVPAQQGLGLDEEQGRAPGADPAGEEHQERPIRWPHVRTFDAPTQHEQSLAQEGVLGEQLRPTPHQVSTDTGRMRQRLRPRPEACTERVTQPGTERQQPMTATATESQRCPPHCRRARAARTQGAPPHRSLPARAVSPPPEAACSPRMDNEP